MTRIDILGFGLAIGLASAAGMAGAQATAPAPDAGSATAASAATAEAEQGLKVFFASGSASIGADQLSVLDQASRLYREGSPIVMVVAGGADTVGAPERNLTLSIRRAQAVAEGLAARGIPIERLQVLGRGNSELEVDTASGVANESNRVVDITWR